MGTKNVLIIDGNEAMQELRARVLRSRGVHVHTAKSTDQIRRLPYPVASATAGILLCEKEAGCLARITQVFLLPAARMYLEIRQIRPLAHGVQRHRRLVRFGKRGAFQ
jgi:hypothetical protein